MLKKMLITALVSAAFFSGSASAVTAAGGIINITGAISDTTCTINGGNRADFAVLLDPITVTDAGFSLSSTTAPSVALSLNAAYDTGVKGDKTAPASDQVTLIASYYKTNASPAKAGPVHSNVI